MTRLRLVPMLVLGAVLIVVGVAFAASPIKGAEYYGRWGPKGNQAPIDFTVSADGTSVSRFNTNGAVPFACASLNLGQPVSTTGKIQSGMFKVTMKLVTPIGHKRTGTLTVTGKFLPGGKAKGTLSSHSNVQPPVGTCNKTVSFTAKS